MTERLLSIRPRLAELAILDSKLYLHGADQHRYQLAPPSDESEIVAFETRHKVVLPSDYRRFLLEVGSAGAGPYYGLNPLGDFQHLREKSLPEDFFAMPFPLRHWLDITNNPGNLSQSEIHSNHWVTGTLCLSHQGCGMYDLLVVSGAESGHVWTDDRTNDLGIFPLAPNRAELGQSSEDAQIFTIAETSRTWFLDWYEWWLDWSFEEVKLWGE